MPSKPQTTDHWSTRLEDVDQNQLTDHTASSQSHDQTISQIGPKSSVTNVTLNCSTEPEAKPKHTKQS